MSKDQNQTTTNATPEIPAELQNLSDENRKSLIERLEREGHKPRVMKVRVGNEVKEVKAYSLRHLLKPKK